MSQSTDATGTTRRRFTKIRAILAGGLVLGVGAAITLAVWNDSEFATGQFAAGHFNIQGSTDGTAFDDHPASGDAATLAYTVDAENLAPGSEVAAPYSIRLDAYSTYDASVAVNVTTSGTVDGLEYRVFTVATADECSPTATAESEIVATTPVEESTDVGSFALTQGTTEEAAGAATNLCIVVTSPSIKQGDSGTVTFEFKATSQA